MRYKIVVEPRAVADLKLIYNFVEKDHGKQKARIFLIKIKHQIKLLDVTINLNRDSAFAKEDEDEIVRDLLYKSYVIVYKVKGNSIYILSVFRLWE
jgi:plasmid stabilization system protein ParE